jgi:NarL family two-component system response regulator LiaR
MTDQGYIRILIVDDHALVRKGISLFLSAYEDLKLIAEGTNGKEAIQLCQQHQPDVILMDLMMPVADGIDGVAAIHRIRDCYSTVQVIALTSFGKEDLIKAAIKAGAIGYLLKNVAADELAAAIHAAVNKQPTLAKEATQVLMNSMSIAEED